MRPAGLTINWDKSDGTPVHGRLHLGFDVDLVFGFLKVPSQDENIYNWMHFLFSIPKGFEFQIVSLLTKWGLSF